MRSEEQLAAVIGLDDVVVVATRDAVLVADRSQTDKVKALVERLKAEGQPEATAACADLSAMGLLPERRPGLALPGQAHRRAPGRPAVAAEAPSSRRALGVVRGAAEVTLNGKVEHVHENESIYLPIGSTHRLANPGKIDLELIEVQTGSYFGEDDIVRIDDDYSRK